MFKKWLARFAIVGLVGVAMGAGVATPAYAADTWLILSDVDGRQVAYMRHVDSVDSFHVGDSYADGYGPTGCVQQYVTYIGWQTQECATNKHGAGTAQSFQFAVSEGLKYRMRLCHAIAGCSYQEFQE